MARTQEEWLKEDHFKGWVRRWSDRAAAWIDNPTPNKLTCIGLVFALGSLPAFWLGDVALGAVLFGLSGATDWFDGSLARWQSERMSDDERSAQARRPFLERRGMTDDGGWFDPLVDKVRYFSALVPLGIGRSWWPLIVLGGLMAAANTAGRPIVARLKLSKGKANKIGKIKGLVEIGVIAWLTLVPAGAALDLCGDVLLAAAGLLGIGSFYGQAVVVWSNSRTRKTPT